MVNKNNIECMWQRDSKFLVNPDKQVWPCCYLGNQGYFMKAIGKHRDSDMLAAGVDDVVHPVMQEYYDYEDELNLANASLEDILNHKWYKETLPNSWNEDKPHRLCLIMCSKNLDETS